MIAIHDVLGLAIIVPFIILWIWKGLDSRLIIGIAVVCLLAAGVLSIWSVSAANEAAIVAYYCLAAGVATVVIEPMVFRTSAAQERREEKALDFKPWIEKMLKGLKVKR